MLGIQRSPQQDAQRPEESAATPPSSLRQPQPQSLNRVESNRVTKASLPLGLQGQVSPPVLRSSGDQAGAAPSGHTVAA